MPCALFPVCFAGEDPAPILNCRIHAIGKHLSDTARSAIASRMTVEPVAGRSMNVTDRNTLHQLVEKRSGASSWRHAIPRLSRRRAVAVVNRWS